MSAKPSTPMGANNLAERYRRVMDQSQKTQEEPDYTKMSLTELGQSVIMFGEAKKGQTFEKVVQSDQSYVAWFTNKFQSSQKHEHRKFLYFVQKFVEKAEKMPIANQAMGQDLPKSQGHMTVQYPEEAVPVIDLSDDEENSLWDVIEGQRQQINQMENNQTQRISNLEVAMGQIMGQLRELAHHLKGPTEQ